MAEDSPGYFGGDLEGKLNEIYSLTDSGCKNEMRKHKCMRA